MVGTWNCPHVYHEKKYPEAEFCRFNKKRCLGKDRCVEYQEMMIMREEDCEFRGYGNREVAYCHHFSIPSNKLIECDERKCPKKQVIPQSMTFKLLPNSEWPIFQQIIDKKKTKDYKR
jgi:hypothetical protein